MASKINNCEIAIIIQCDSNNHMNLPLIIVPMKKNDRKPILQQPVAPEEFGLGIQVFKIDSKVDHDPQRQRKAIQNIENPKQAEHSKPTGFQRAPERSKPDRSQMQQTKKPHILPSLSTEKKWSATCQTEPRKNTVEKRVPGFPASIKEAEQKKPIEKKGSWGPQTTKNSQPESAPTKEKEIIQEHFIKSMNDLTNFYQKLEEIQLENAKEIRRLKKEKQNVEEQLQWRLQCKSDRKGLIDIVIQSQDCFFQQEELYDEWGMQNYVENGFKFKCFDVVQQIQQ